MGKSIEIQNLTFRYDRQEILKQLNLIIGRKTFMSIIGPNGSGKTTLLKNIARNVKPDQGAVLIDQKDIATYTTSDLAKEMAVVHQNPEVDVEFTVYDVVMMGRHPYIPRFKRESVKDKDVVDQALRWTNMTHLQDRLINEISGGEKQRVMIAKAIAQEPQLLLLDEPTSFLDIHHQIEILELLKKLNREKHISVIAVIHDLNLAARYSDEVLLLYQGRVVALGRTEKVMTAERLQKAYEMDMIIDRNVYTGSLQISPLSVHQSSQSNNIKLHVIGGGGMAKEVLLRCYQEGFRVSLGVINQGDSDGELGKKLGVELVEEEPFCDISEKTLDQAHQLATSAHAVILTSIPFGRGNLKNLIIARNKLASGQPVYLYNTYKNDVSYDYVGGEGKRLLEQLREMGLKEYRSIDELLESVKNLEGDRYETKT